MSGGVAGYAAVCARVRVKYSNLLAAPDFRRLAESPDLTAFREALKSTAYGRRAEGAHTDQEAKAELAGSFARILAEEASSVIRATPAPARRVVAKLHSRHEVNNVKAVLRGIAAARPGDDQATTWSRVRPLIFPLGNFSALRLERMTDAGGVPGAVEMLRGTPYHEALVFALKRYSAEQSLFPLEVALDLTYWRGLWQETQKLSGEDHRQAARVIGTLIDANNLMWAIRYKVYKQLSEEELINYTLSSGFRVRDSDIRAIAAGADIDTIIKRLYPELHDSTVPTNDWRAGLPQLETALRRAMATRCMAAFLGNPFHVGLPLAYLVLHDLEVQDLTTLLEAKSTSASAEEYQPFLLGIPMAA